MGKKRTNKRRIKKRASKRSKNIGGENEKRRDTTQVSLSNSSIGFNGDEATKAVNAAIKGDDIAALGIGLGAVKNLNIDKDDAKAAAKLAKEHGPTIFNFVRNMDRDSNLNYNEGRVNRLNQTGQMGQFDQMGQIGQMDQFGQQQLPQQQQQQQQQQILKINKEDVDTGIHAAKEVLNLVGENPSLSGVKDEVVNSLGKTANAAGKTAEAVGKTAEAAGALVTVTAAPLLLQEQVVNTAVGILKGFNAAPAALFSTAKWAASDPLSLQYIDSNGIGRRTKWAMAADLKRSLKKITDPMYIKKKQILETIYEAIKDYKIKIRCKKGPLDLFYSNNFMPEVVWVCKEQIRKDIITDIETQYKNIEIELQDKITEIIAKFNELIGTTKNIKDKKGYLKFYEEDLNPKLNKLYELSYDISNTMDRIGADGINVIKDQTSKDQTSKDQTKDGGKRKSKRKGGKKSKKSKNSSKRKTLRKKRT